MLIFQSWYGQRENIHFVLIIIYIYILYIYILQSYIRGGCKMILFQQHSICSSVPLVLKYMHHPDHTISTITLYHGNFDDDKHTCTGNWNMPHIMLNLYPEYIFFIKNQEQFPQCSYVILHKKAKQKHVHAYKIHKPPLLAYLLHTKIISLVQVQLVLCTYLILK